MYLNFSELHTEQSQTNKQNTARYWSNWNSTTCQSNASLLRIAQGQYRTVTKHIMQLAYHRKWVWSHLQFHSMEAIIECEHNGMLCYFFIIGCIRQLISKSMRVIHYRMLWSISWMQRRPSKIKNRWQRKQSILGHCL